MKVWLEWVRSGHDRVTIFVGEDREHRGNTGTLVFAPGEAEVFRNTVRQGIFAPGYTGIFEKGWGEE